MNVDQHLPWQCWPGEDVGLVEEEEVDWDLLSFLQPAEWWGLLDTGVLTPPLGDWSWAGVTLGGSLGLAGAGDLGTDWGTLLTLLLWEAACLAHRFGSDCLQVLSVWNNNFSDWLQNWRTKKTFFLSKVWLLDILLCWWWWWWLWSLCITSELMMIRVCLGDSLVMTECVTRESGQCGAETRPGSAGVSQPDLAQHRGLHSVLHTTRTYQTTKTT